VQRQMGFGSYNTVHLMCHKIRSAMMQPEEKLGGIVEMDETFVDGKDTNRHWDKKKGHHDRKIPVIGAVQRKGNVVARVLDRMTSQAMLSFVKETISDKVSLLATDDWVGYSDYLRKYPHQSVDHSKHQYVVSAVHTNTIEGFWSIFKRGVVGKFHKVSAKYLPLYVAEFQFRYSNRANAELFDAVVSGC
jgi:transposase-like protein